MMELFKLVTIEIILTLEILSVKFNDLIRNLLNV